MEHNSTLSMPEGIPEMIHRNSVAHMNKKWLQLDLYCTETQRETRRIYGFTTLVFKKRSHFGLLLIFFWQICQLTTES